jgi:DNA-binding Xre family transcriptional regulator
MRKEAGLSQTETARRRGISQPTLNRLETASQNATLRTLTQICRALQCKVGDLFEVRVKWKASGGRSGDRPGASLLADLGVEITEVPIAGTRLFSAPRKRDARVK